MALSHFVVPGLIGHLPRLQLDGDFPKLPHLTRLLTRAEQVVAPEAYAQTLFDLFRLPVDTTADLATAAVCYLADANVSDANQYPLHADPLFLRPDQDRLLAFELSSCPLTETDAAQFAASFNQHFTEDGLQLLIPNATRWYLSVAKQPQLQTRPLFEVLGRNIDFYLPEGHDATQWRAWMNELQMLFYSHPVNEQRESRGEFRVSSLWFSGGGYLPQQEAVGFSVQQGECELLSGLNKLASSQRDEMLVLDHAAGRAVINADANAWKQALIVLDQKLEAAMQNELILYPCEGTAWHWQPSMKWKIWQRTKPLSHWLSES